MSRFENIVQTSNHGRRISHRLQYIPCGRCCAAIGYDRGADWSAVNNLVNEHWRACPAKPLARSADTTRTPTFPLDTAIVLPPPVTPDQGSSPSLVAGSVSSPGHTWISSGCERKRRTLEQRKLELEQDEYAENITTKSVVCKGCHKEISLDKRSKYYPGLWNKHKGKCHGIEKLERARTKTPQVPNGTRPAPCDVIIPGFGGHGYGDVLQLGPAERYERHSAGHTHRLVRHYDLEDSSSDDEEDEDLETHEPFPTLNSVFYRAQRLCDHSDAWAYRYATNEEITSNVFHGQDELYAHLDAGARPFSYLSLDCCDVPRCVIKSQVERGDLHPEDTKSTKELRRPDKDSTELHTLSWQSDPSSY